MKFFWLLMIPIGTAVTLTQANPGIAAVYSYKNPQLNCRTDGLELAVRVPEELEAFRGNRLHLTMNSQLFDTPVLSNEGISQHAFLLPSKVNGDLAAPFAVAFFDPFQFSYELRFNRRDMLTNAKIDAVLSREHVAAEIPQSYALQCEVSLEKAVAYQGNAVSDIFLQLNDDEKALTLRALADGLSLVESSSASELPPQRQALMAAVVDESLTYDSDDSALDAVLAKADFEVVATLTAEVRIQLEVLQQEWLSTLTGVVEEDLEWIDDYGWHLGTYAVASSQAEFLGFVGRFTHDEATDDYDDDHGFELVYCADGKLLQEVEFF